MLFSLFRPDPAIAITQQLYGAVVARARDPWFFAELTIPDTVMGRFDMLAMHVYLLARRLVNEDSGDYRSLNQQVFDLFVDDVDRALRELGVGDTTVPKRKKKMVRSFYGQIEDFDQHLDSQQEKAMLLPISKRYFSCGDGELHQAAKMLAGYMMLADEFLIQQSITSIESGNLTWPEIQS